MNRRGRIVGLAGLLLGLGSSGPEILQAQQRQQRVTPARETPAVNPAQAEVLMERFAQRVAEALRLDDRRAGRLQRELQTSRRERERIAIRTRELRRQLNQLVRQGPADEARVGELLDELVDLQGQAAMVVVDEQKRLSEFLSPLQRARYLYLRQRLVRQALERQRARTDVPPRDNPDFPS
jgi:hypothetical protein